MPSHPDRVRQNYEDDKPSKPQAPPKPPQSENEAHARQHQGAVDQLRGGRHFEGPRKILRVSVPVRRRPGQARRAAAAVSSTVYDREDIFNLLRSINSRVDTEHQVGFDVLRKEFDAWWPDLQKRIDEILVTQQLENETGFDWLYTTKDLVRHMATPKHIWVVAQHLYRKALVSPTRDVLNQNLKTGADYTFVVSSTDDVAELQRIAAAAPGHVRIIQIDEEEFQSAAVTDYFILDPDSDTLTAARGYWIEVDREAAIGLVGRFRKYATRDTVA